MDDYKQKEWKCGSMKGIILAGGNGTRLHPLTHGISKQLLPVYKQPMIYYPLKTLIDMNIKEILIIVSNHAQYMIFYKYLGDGSEFGVHIEYICQGSPRGLADAFIIGDNFIGSDNVTLILGDNVFLLNKSIDAVPNTIFTYKVREPSAYGVAKLNTMGDLEDIVEKPKEFIGEDAVVGLYIFTNSAIKYAKTLTPSARGEIEIVDLIKKIMRHEYIEVQEIDGVWFDCGTHDDLLECAEYVRALTKRTTRDILLKRI